MSAVNLLFFVLSVGFFFNTGEYWTHEMPVVKKVSIVVLRKGSHILFRAGKPVHPWGPSCTHPHQVRRLCCQVLQGIGNLQHRFPFNKETIRCFFNSLSPKSQRYFLAFSKLETSFLKSGLIASSSSSALPRACRHSEQVLPRCSWRNFLVLKWMISGIWAWIVTVKMNRRERLSWNLQNEAGNWALVLMRLHFWDVLWNHNS